MKLRLIVCCFLALCNKLTRSAACQQHPHLLKMKKSSHVQAEQQNKLCGPDTTQPSAPTLGNMARARSKGFLANIPGKDTWQVGRTAIHQTSAPKIN